MLAAACCLAAAGCDPQMQMRTQAQRPGGALTHDDVLAKAGLENYWQLDLELPRGEKVRKLVLLEENLYCLTHTNWLIAVDASKGLRKWSYKVADAGVKVYPPCHAANVAIDPNHVGVQKVKNLKALDLLPKRNLVMINTPDYMVALDRSTGELHRQIRFDTPGPTQFTANTGGSCDGRYYYVGTLAGEVKSIRVNESVVAWGYLAGSIVSAAPKVHAPPGAEPRVYVGSGDGDFAVLKSGFLSSTLWPLPGARPWPEMLGGVVANLHVDNRAAFVPCLNQRLYAFGLAGGEPLWWFTAKGQLWDDVQASENSIFQYARKDAFYAIDPATGKSRWSMKEPRRVLAVMPVDGAPTAYLIDGARNLLVVDEILGKVQVTIPMTGVDLFVDNTTAPAIFVGDQGGRLVCLRQIGAERMMAETLKKP